MKHRIHGNSLIDYYGSVITKIRDEGEDDKYFAVFAQCGHCGDEYFIPIVFAFCCKDYKVATELARNNARVKNGRKGEIMYVFEITKLELEYISQVNQHHDPYLSFAYSHEYDKRNEQIIDRRVMHSDIAKKVLAGDKEYEHLQVKTKDEYDRLATIFEGNFAPIKMGDKIVYPNLNYKKIMMDYYRSTVKRYGIYRDNSNVLLNYYLLFGEKNSYNIHIEGNSICYTKLVDDEYKSFKIELAPQQIRKLQENEELGNIGKIRNKYFRRGTTDPAGKLLKLADKLVDYDNYNKPSKVDKFNARLVKSKSKISEDDSVNNEEFQF